MSAATLNKPKQLRPFAIVVTLIELGLALWALTLLLRYWRAADGPLPGAFWGAAALFGFTASLVLTNGIGMLQTLASLNRRPPLGSRLPVRLPAVEDPHRDIITGLIPLILAFGLPVYPLLRLAWLNWLDLGVIWVGLSLIGTLIALGCGYVIGRQIYLIIIGSQTAVEVSHETISPDQTIQVSLAHRPGRVPTQALEARLVCRQTVRHRSGNKGHRYVTTVLHEDILGAYTGADIPPLQMGSAPVTSTIPEDARLSTDPDDYPTVEWRIEVVVKVAQAPDFRLTFPFKVT